MGAGLAAAQVIIVHGGQVVMHQRIGVQHFDRCGDACGAGLADTEKRGTFHHQEGAQAFAAAQGGIAHGLSETGLGAFDRRQQDFQGLLDGCGDTRHFPAQINPDNGAFGRHDAASYQGLHWGGSQSLSR